MPANEVRTNVFESVTIKKKKVSQSLLCSHFLFTWSLALTAVFALGAKKRLIGNVRANKRASVRRTEDLLPAFSRPLEDDEAAKRERDVHEQRVREGEELAQTRAEREPERTDVAVRGRELIVVYMRNE